jgi:hypothetical protein
MAATVNQYDLTNAQAKVVLESVQRSIGYLFRLKTRMEQRGFTRTDLYSLVCKALVAVQDVAGECHRLSVRSEHWNK